MLKVLNLLLKSLVTGQNVSLKGKKTFPVWLITCLLVHSGQMLITFWKQSALRCNCHQSLWSHSNLFGLLFSPTDLWQVSKQLSEEYEKIVNPEKAAEDTKPVKIKEEPVSDITFPISEELEGDLASGDQSLPVGVLGAQSERFSANLEVEASPQTSGRGFLLLLETVC